MPITDAEKATDAIRCIHDIVYTSEDRQALRYVRRRCLELSEQAERRLRDLNHEDKEET